MAITAEITWDPHNAGPPASDESLIDCTLDGLARMGIAAADAVTFRAIHRTRYAYVVRTIGYAERLKPVLDYIAGLGILSVGRNAEFEYINMDEAVRRGLAAARSLWRRPRC
jgi:protoporphyrinogen oxidase